jgi:hypothetical protein
MAVSEHDREYMRRLGAHKAEANALSAERHLLLSPKERLEAAMRLSEEYRSGFDVAAYLDDDNPAELYARARRLGLIRPSSDGAPARYT